MTITAHTDQSYTEKRDALTRYFDSTALDAWKRFATDAPMSRVRSIVRDGRAEMHAALLARFPANLTGWRILDAGCGGGALALDLARRGATVHGMDLSAQIIELANEQAAEAGLSDKATFEAGDALAADCGVFDAVVSMDCLIHYSRAQVVNIVNNLDSRTTRQISFSVAPATPLLLAKHRLGNLFPKADRAPTIQPVRLGQLAKDLQALDGWTFEACHKVAKPFYISQVVEVRHV
ncbi:MAG: magnesium protoporphyrin IX methyltransferase [Pseudomonadota bacterium]